MRKLNLAKISGFLLLVVLVIGLHLTYIVYSLATFQEGVLQVQLLDVGQGDAMLITTPDNLKILIDAGKGNDVVYALDEVLPIWGRDIDVMIATHPDADHIEGYLELLAMIQPKYFFMNESTKTNSLISSLELILKQSDAQVRTLDQANDFRVGCCTEFKVLFPAGDQTIFDEEDSNDQSVGLLISYGDVDMFTAGDLSADLELEAMKHIPADRLPIEILKVGHHGSKTSTSKALLDMLKPSYALIGVGEGNSYGHPAEEVIDILNSHNVQIYRTDLDGTVILNSDGFKIWK